MNLLIDALPETVEVGGKQVAISTDFRTGIRFELLMQEGEGDPQTRLIEALRLYYPVLPNDIEGALAALLCFYRCGEKHFQETAKSAASARKVAQSYCFRQDASLILAAFRAAYGIDLAEVEGLHWFTFRALFFALPADCELKTVMGYRVADTKGMSKAERKHFEQMKRQYALKRRGTAREVLTLAERDRRMRTYVAERFEKAKI